MASYNKVIMIGNLTRDPEYKQLTSGHPVCRLGLASNRQYKNKQTGVMVQEVCFVDIDVFGAQAESCRQYLQKGRGVLIEGRLKFDTWQTPESQTRSKHSIIADRVVFLSSAQVSEQLERTMSSPNFTPEAVKERVETIQAAQKVDQEPVEGQSVQSEQVLQANEQSKSPETGEIAFKDEPPFQDDLPF